MSREVIATDRAPAAVGPYSQACSAGKSRTLYLSGQIPIDPKSGELLRGSVAEQAQRCMDNLEGVLQAAGLGFGHVVRCTIYLTDMGDFAAVNEVYGRCFDDPPPARACVQVAALPKGAQVEIDAIAERD
ncbi:MAG: RidA family protein [Deltaproteobacteria bacterium]|nr:RidA family protein [Deltaproteobacteria bacterium]